MSILRAFLFCPSNPAPVQRLLWIVLAFGIAPAAAQEPRPIPADSVLALPTAWETYYVVLLRAAPDASAARDPEAVQTLLNAHIQYQLRLQAEGRAVAAGGFAPDTSAADASVALVGLTLLRAGSQEEADAWARADPAVAAGYFRVDVRAWYVPAGKLPER